MESFEHIAGLLEEMEVPSGSGRLRVEWIAKNTIGVGKDYGGGYCVLLVGHQLTVTVPSVKRAMRYGLWKTEAGGQIEANLLSLPAGEQFLTAAAAIVAEFARRGMSRRPFHAVFAEVEEFVALVLRRVLLPPEFVLGLVGELLILSELLTAMPGACRLFDDPTAMWRGWMQQARDFVLGEAAIEVKTTGLQVSRHHIQGLEQVEPRTVDGSATERLFLASIGLRRADAGLYSVAALTDQNLHQLRDEQQSNDKFNDAQLKLLDRIAQYGPNDSTGYVHVEMAELDPYREAYTTTFPPRFYEMSDQNIRIIRATDLAQSFHAVRPQGLSYTIELPPTIPGSIDNPRADFRQLLRALVASP